MNLPQKSALAIIGLGVIATPYQYAQTVFVMGKPASVGFTNALMVPIAVFVVLSGIGMIHSRWGEIQESWEQDLQEPRKD